MKIEQKFTKMKTAIVFAAVCIAFAAAGPVIQFTAQQFDAPQGVNQPAEPQIVSYQSDNAGYGPYNFA